MALSLGDRRIWGLLAIVVLTTASILGLRMLGLYEGFDAPESPADSAPAESEKDKARRDTASEGGAADPGDAAEGGPTGAPSPLPAAAKGALR